jgi:hypothetical protein
MALAADDRSIVQYLDVPEWVHDLVFAPLLLALILLVCCHRARALGRRGVFAPDRRGALLADFASADDADAAEGAAEGDARSDAPLIQRAEQLACLALAAISTAVLGFAALPSTSANALAAERRIALVGAACAAAAWGASAWLVFHERAAHKLAGRSLRLWWLCAALPQTLQLRSDILALVRLLNDEAAADGGGARARARTVLLALRVASYAPALFLAGCGLFQTDTQPPPARGHAPPAQPPQPSHLEGLGRADDAGGGYVPPSPSGSLAAAFPPPPPPLHPPPSARLAGDATASLWDMLTFRWANPIFKIGAARPLEHADLFALPAEDGALANQQLLDGCWRLQRLRTPRGATPSFLAALGRAYGVHFLKTGGLKALNDLTVFTGASCVCGGRVRVRGSGVWMPWVRPGLLSEIR